MAIDSSLYTGVIPAGTYAAGDKIQLACVRGPSIVRDGYGAAILKKIFSVSTAQLEGHVIVKNSNWVDEVSNVCPGPSNIGLAPNSNGVQPGHDADLMPNSGWDIYFVFDSAGTTTAARDVYVIIDVDYPKVQAIAAPMAVKGLPTSTVRHDAITGTAAGASNAIIWTTYNVDILKAGYKYLISSAFFRSSGGDLGFFSVSGAAGQAGLERIIPVVPSSLANLRYVLDYSTPLVKGPFNINYAVMDITGAITTTLEIDWVKK